MEIIILKINPLNLFVALIFKILLLYPIPSFAHSLLEELSKNENLNKIIYLLINYYKNVKTSERMMSNNFHRNLFLRKLVDDMNEIKYAINMN